MAESRRLEPWVVQPTSVTYIGTAERPSAFIASLALRTFTNTWFGVGAYGMDQAYLRWKKHGAKFHPHIVIFGFVAGNVQDNVNMVVAQAAVAALQDTAEMLAATQRNASDRQEFFSQAARRDLRAIPSYANFAMLDAGHPATQVVSYFKQNGILLGRRFPPMDNFVRVSFGRPNEMQQFWRVWDGQAASKPLSS